MTKKRGIRAGCMVLALLLCFISCGGVLPYRATLIRQLPSWVILSEKQETIMIHAEKGEETININLKNGELSLNADQPLYKSNHEWLVIDCMIFDIDHDQNDEILLHVWKKGSFGEYQPFWREKDNKTIYSEHLFIYEWDISRADRLDPKWMSSAMPVTGEQVIAEENGDILILSHDGNKTLWRWEEWGLILVTDEK